MVSSDSESDIERVSSVKSNVDNFETVPKDLEFKFKMQNIIGRKLAKFSYVLKEGKELPYLVSLKVKLDCG